MEVGYLARKQREIDFLSEYCDPGASERITQNSNIVSLKRELVSTIRRRVFTQVGTLPASADTDLRRFTVGQFTFNYRYQRYDLSCDENRFARKIYGSSIGEVESWGCFVNSGMAAIRAAIDGLSGLTSETLLTLQAPADSYFESSSLLSRTTGIRAMPVESSSSFDTHADIWWIDSVSKLFSVPALISKNAPPAVACVDTTCFEADHPALVDLVATLLRRDIVVVLVRSHTKLDGLGVEYARLGSISLLVAPEASLSTRGIFQKLILVIREAIAQCGSCCEPHHIPPYLGTNVFFHLNRLRLESLRESGKIITSRLAELYGERLLGFQHELFVSLPFSTEAERDEAAAVIEKAADKAEIALSKAPSFGFDFMTYDYFRDGRSNETLLRLCFSDLPAEQSARFGELLVNTLNPDRPAMKKVA